MSAASFRVCDFKNFGISDLCNFGASGGSGSLTLDPPMWGAGVIEQYREGKRILISFFVFIEFSFSDSLVLFPIM